MKERNLFCVILAAGKGTRMKSALPKVLHPVAGRPMLVHVLRSAERINPKKIIVVVGPDMDLVVDAAKPHETVLQADQFGTGHAVRTALSGRNLENTDVLVLYGDVPLTPPDVLQKLIEQHRMKGSFVTILAMNPKNPTGYGRVITDDQKNVTAIVEEIEATESERSINLCNSGMMLLRGEGLNEFLGEIKNKNTKGEYYLTDILSLIQTRGHTCSFIESDFEDLNGVNDRIQLARAEGRLQNKLREFHMRNGVTMIDPQTVYLSMDTDLGKDVVIGPNVFFGSGVTVADNVQILANCYLEDVTISRDVKVGPFARIRAGTILEERVEIGNFVELNKAKIGKETKAKHLNYLGYVTVGDSVNIGAGTLLSNYDGKNKTHTHIHDRAFIGANTTIVSPVTIGQDSYVAAGSVITDDVPAGKLAFGRARQSVREHTEKTRGYSKKKKGE